jgi:hypothetical protein
MFLTSKLLTLVTGPCKFLRISKNKWPIITSLEDFEGGGF